MDLISFVALSCIFTGFGYIWGRTAVDPKKRIELIVSATMDSLERQGYLRSKMIDGELYYIKWPDTDAKDS